MDCSPQGSSVHGFSRPEYWSGLPCSTPGDLPDPGIEPTPLKSPSLAGGFFTTRATWEAKCWYNNVPLEALGGNPFPCPCLLLVILHSFRASKQWSVVSHCITWRGTLLSLSSKFKDFCHYLRPTEIIQDNLPILR